MSDEHPSGNSTPQDVLLRRLMDSNVAKNETERMAVRVISDLTEKNDSLLALAKLGRWVLQMREDSCWDDLRGEDIQGKSGELGLIEEVDATESCGDNCICADYHAFPMPCLRLTSKAKVLDK